MFGVLFLVLGAVALSIGIVFFLKMKRIAGAPFMGTGEIAQNPGVADAKGMISTEGEIVAGQAVAAPCSGQPCLYYEVTIEREWEKLVKTQEGTKTQSGSTRVTTNKGGAVFQLNDGTGVVHVDARESVDADLTKAHDERIAIGMMLPGELVFGHMRMQTPVNLGPERTTGFKVVEKILPAQGKLYACGKLANGAISKPGWSSLILSHKGRTALLGSSKTRAMVGLIAGAVFMVSAVPAFIFGPKASADTGGCPTALSDAQSKCEDRIYSADGKDYAWTVTKPGLYTIRIVQPPVANPIDSTITVKDSAGAQVGYNDGGKPGADAVVSQVFAAGTYSINVRDFSHEEVQGGFSYSLLVSFDGAQAPALPAASADVAPAASAAGATTLTSATVHAPAKVAAAKPAKPATGKPAKK